MKTKRVVRAWSVPTLVAPLFLVGCTGSVSPTTDAGGRKDAARQDSGAGKDSGPGDAAVRTDAGTVDTGTPDGGRPDSGAEEDAGQVGCTYPPHSNEMALGQVMPSFSWPEASDPAGSTAPLSLIDVFCDTDPSRDWGPSDLLLFIAWPEW